MLLSAAIPALGLLYSLPFVTAVWNLNARDIADGIYPPRFLKDILNTFIYFGYYFSFLVLVINTIFYKNRLSVQIWNLLTAFYLLAIFIMLFTSSDLPAETRIILVSFIVPFLLLLASLSYFSSRLSDKRRRA